MLKLKLLRIVGELTLDQTAKGCGLHASDVCRYEKGQMRPYPLHAKRLESYFGRPITELLTEVNVEEVWKEI